MIYITKKVEFCAGHRLVSPAWSPEKNREAFGPCASQGGHGHNYVLEVTVRGEINADTGMLVNLRQLKQVLEREIIERLDHRDLNADPVILRGRIPTAENLAVAIWEHLRGKLPGGELHEIKIQETASNSVTYRGEE